MKSIKQGPALLVYNDAVFTRDDWKGIRMLNDSIKENDPMKVGRFGLGFKSVFHMTGNLLLLLTDQYFLTGVRSSAILQTLKSTEITAEIAFLFILMTYQACNR